MTVVSGVITASEPSWTVPFTGLSRALSEGWHPRCAAKVRIRSARAAVDMRHPARRPRTGSGSRSRALDPTAPVVRLGRPTPVKGIYGCLASMLNTSEGQERAHGPSGPALRELWWSSSPSSAGTASTNSASVGTPHSSRLSSAPVLKCGGVDWGWSRPGRCGRRAGSGSVRRRPGRRARVKLTGLMSSRYWDPARSREPGY